jgi:hypothetical protein
MRTRGVAVDITIELLSFVGCLAVCVVDRESYSSDRCSVQINRVAWPRASRARFCRENDLCT